jgi:alpha-galactosidase
MDNLKIAYIGGGSRGWDWGFMKDVALDGELCGEVRLYDIDMAAAENTRVIGEKISAHPKAASRWRYSVAQSLRESLDGANFVVISILPGTFKAMRRDVHAPDNFGL